ncbi:glycoside hydrolase family 3 C-terminal domain-containing protein [Bacillus sp. D386]|uniref:glycoside hydrolase family 3 C-terminal domain-containing protein n=1 Tax=Bacillus sp. D386 TaxID=2587155 RepID=UPI00112094DE|nr:glycoside hydrolase family 3 C-terminal domain-containing protein [Bacillus sp. D386]
MKTEYTYLFQNIKALLEDRVKDLVSQLTLEEKINQMCQYQDAVPRLGIKKYKHGTEGAHGIAWLGEATVFPQNIGLACTWNVNLMKEIGSVIGDEARIFYQKDPEHNGLTIWSPTVDMERDPRWGRTEEAYGEDPCLTGKLTTELIKGMQGEHPFYLKTAATLKHFLGNNNEVNRGECSVSLDPRNLNEYYLKAFERQIKEGKAQSIMTAYNAVNGTLCNMNPDVNEIIKKEWGMDGFVVSDAGDVLGSVNEHHYVESYSKAVAYSIKNGIDNITDDKDITVRAIRDALEQEYLLEEDLDKALCNTFRVRFRLGEFDSDGENPYSYVSAEKLASKEHYELSLKAARESIVLLKNNGILPLKNKKVAVIGPLADEVLTDWYSGTPPYSITPLKGIKGKIGETIPYADGSNRIRLSITESGKSIGVNPDTGFLLASENEGDVLIHTDWGWGSETLRSEKNGKFITVDDDLHLKATADEAKGWFVKEVFTFSQKEESMEILSWDKQPIQLSDDGSIIQAEGMPAALFSYNITEDGIQKAVEEASKADTAIIFAGNNPFINGKECIDRPDLTLPPAQERLIQEVLKVNSNTVVVIVGSYPYAVNWVNAHVPAIIYTSHAGPELGRAIADVLFGDYNPAGRLPMTWYQSVNQLPEIMDYDIIKGKRTYQYFDGEVLYPFGHGLSYSQFEYKNLELSKESVTKEEVLHVTAEISNRSNLDGDEVVQLYVRCNQSKVIRPIKTLRDFERVHIKGGETKKIILSIEVKDLAYWDVAEERFLLEDGTYTVMLGSSSKAIQLEKTVEITGETRTERTLKGKVNSVHYDDYYSVKMVECLEGRHAIQSIGSSGWIMYKDVKIKANNRMMKIRLANGGKQTDIEVRTCKPNGKLLCTLQAPSTGGYQAWTTVEKSFMDIEEDKVEDIYLLFKDEVAIHWLTIE